MQKPQLKRKVAIYMYSKASGLISFYATADAASEFEEFGQIRNWGNSMYHLYVDSRYDFSQVLQYMQEYG